MNHLAHLDEALGVEAGRQLHLPPQGVKMHGTAAHLGAQQHLRVWKGAADSAVSPPPSAVRIAVCMQSGL